MTVKIWWFRVREHMSKIILVVVLSGLGYGVYYMRSHGMFDQGFGPAVSNVLQKVPFFGSRFRSVTLPESELGNSQFNTPIAPPVATIENVPSLGAKHKSRPSKRHKALKRSRRNR